MPNWSIVRAGIICFFGEPISLDSVKQNLSWVAGSLAMAVVAFLMFDLRNHVIRAESPTAITSISARSALEEINAVADSKLQNWYIATQLTLDSVFPVLYGCCFFALIMTFIPNDFQKTGQRLVLALMAADYVENILEVCYLSYFRLEWVVWIAVIASQLKWTFLVAFLVVIVVRLLGRLAIGLWHVRDGELMRGICASFDRITRLRFPLLALGFFTFWGYIAVRTPGVQSIAANMLLLDNFEQIGLLACINALAVIFAVAMLRAVWHHIDINLNKNEDVKSGAWLGWHFLLVFILNLLTPMTAYHYSQMQRSLTFKSEVQIYSTYAYAFFLASTGFVAAFVLMWCFGQLTGFLIGQTKDDSNFFPGENRDQRARLIDLRHKPATHFAFQMVFYFVLLACLFFVVFNQFEEHLPWLSIPAYMIMLVWLIATLMTRVSLWFDPSRIPTTVLIVLIVLIARYYDEPQLLPVVPHPALDSKSPVKTEEEPVWVAIRKRFENLDKQNGEQSSKKPKTLVVVTCPGGGIHAAAWSAIVLKKLDQRYEDFSSSICLISGVSGGSVGTVFFANSRYIKSTDSKTKLDDQNRETVMESSLGAIGAGLAFHDIPSAFCPWWPGEDRGVRLEKDWRVRMKGDSEKHTLSAWGDLALQGRMPIVILNATDAASGRRVLFSTVPLPPRASLVNRVGRPWDYRELFDSKNYDMDVATAARASATFPYASPFTIPDNANAIGKRVALCDGGFVDNEGIVTAIDWLDSVGIKANNLYDDEKDPEKKKLVVPFQRILLLRIQPSSDLDVGGSDSAERTIMTQMRWLTGPIEALATMRTSSQVERGLLESDLASLIDTPWGANAVAPVGIENAIADATTKADKESSQKSRYSATMANRKVQSEINSSDLNLSKRLNDSNKTGAYTKTAMVSTDKPKSDSVNAKQSNLPKTVVNASTLPDVVVCNIVFDHPEPQEPIPLNWKLSPKQMKWYGVAWTKMVEASTKETDTPKDEPSESSTNPPTSLQVLDILFNKRPESERKSSNN